LRLHGGHSGTTGRGDAPGACGRKLSCGSRRLSPGPRCRLGASTRGVAQPLPVDARDAGRRGPEEAERRGPCGAKAPGSRRGGAAHVPAQNPDRVASPERERRGAHEHDEHDHDVQQPEADRNEEGSPEDTERGNRSKTSLVARELSRHGPPFCGRPEG
jgi:hypothetical protein